MSEREQEKFYTLMKAFIDPTSQLARERVLHWANPFVGKVQKYTVLRGNKGHKFSPEIAHCPLLVRTVPYWSRLFFSPKICLAYQYLSFAFICQYARFKKGKFDCTIFGLILRY